MKESQEKISSTSERFVNFSGDLADRLQLIMEQKGISSAELGVKMGVSELEVSRWLSGMQNLTLRNVASLEAALDTEVVMVLPQDVTSNQVLTLLGKKRSVTSETTASKTIDWSDRNRYVPLPKSFDFIPEGHPLLEGILFTNDLNDIIGKYTFYDDRDGSDWGNDRLIKVTYGEKDHLFNSDRFYFVEDRGFIYAESYEAISDLANTIYPEESLYKGW
jgi:transcriptional regulator with XRE-family HTH domain